MILFARNVRDTAQVAALTRELRTLWPAEGPTPLIAVDQEGGPVRRLRAPGRPDVCALPAAREIGAVGDATWTRELAATAGRQLAALGFNVDFAPVLDVDSNPANPVIARRAFGTTPEAVIEHGLAFAAGLADAGIVACGKHFPGHGDTDVDSHLALPTLPHDLARLSRTELVPFEAAAEAGVPAMMSAHIVFEALDGDWPATLSPVVIPELLRARAGFEGVVFSDDLEMRAVAANYDPATVARQGLLASIDCFLICHRLDLARAVRDALDALDATSEDHARRLDRALARLAALRAAASDHAARPWPGEVPDQARATALLSRG